MGFRRWINYQDLCAKVEIEDDYTAAWIILDGEEYRFDGSSKNEYLSDTLCGLAAMVERDCLRVVIHGVSYPVKEELYYDSDDWCSYDGDVIFYELEDVGYSAWIVLNGEMYYFRSDIEVYHGDDWAESYVNGFSDVIIGLTNEVERDLEIISDDERVSVDVASAIELVRKDKFALKRLSADLINNREVVLAAIAAQDEDNHRTLKYASDALKNDREFILKVLQQDGMSLKYASDALKNDREVVLAAISGDYYAMPLRYAPDELKNDREFILAAIENGSFLEWPSLKLKDNKESSEVISNLEMVENNCASTKNSEFIPLTLGARIFKSIKSLFMA